MKSRLLCLILLSAVLVQAAPPVEEGKAIFTSRCAGCHNVHKIVLGPALAGVEERHSIDWIVNFVHSSQTLIQKGDKEAVALFKQFNNIPMPDHKDLSKEQIVNVVEYIKAEATSAQQPKTLTPDKEKHPESLWQIIVGSPGLLVTYALLFTVLTGVLLLARQVRKLRRQLPG